MFVLKKIIFFDVPLTTVPFDYVGSKKKYGEIWQASGYFDRSFMKPAADLAHQ